MHDLSNIAENAVRDETMALYIGVVAPTNRRRLRHYAAYASFDAER